jgi:tetratricopeptide (TPR) repeat protein
VKARTGGRRTNPDVPKAPPAFEPETWIDEGSVRAEAVAATQRASEQRVRKAPAVDPETAEAIDRVTTARRSERLRGRLVQAQESLDRDRFAEARRLGQSLLKELSDVPAVHEVVGLASYRLGKWREAASALETQRAMTGGVRNHPVLADCYRALRKYDKVDELWAELREVSPNPELMAEGRIVAAGALADRGDLAGAIRLMSKTADSPRRVRDHHLKQWYVLADLYDRSGDVVKARHLFSRIRSLVPDYADVDDRLRGLGR